MQASLSSQLSPAARWQLAAVKLRRQASEKRYTRPETDEELRAFLRERFGVALPATRVCPHHTPPFRAFADAYFARSPIAVWKASRGFGGKTFMLALLALTEAATLGAEVTVLGGSGEQSKRVHEYMSRWSSGVESLLDDDPTARLTRLNNGGRILALMASSRSVRGPHPQRLRLDECMVGETPVLTSAGYVRLDSIRAGHTVIAWSDSSGFVPRVVQSFIGRGIRQTLTLTLEDGREVTCTPEHKIKTRTSWRATSELRVGDYLFGKETEDGSVSAVQNIAESGWRSAQRQSPHGLVSEVLRNFDSHSCATLPSLRQAEERCLPNARGMLSECASEAGEPLSELRQATEAGRNAALPALLADTPEPGGYDAAHGSGAGDCAQGRYTLKGRIAVRRTVDDSRHGIRATDRNQSLYRGLLGWQFSDRSPRQLLARPASGCRARQAQARISGADGLSCSLPENRPHASLVAVVAIRPGPVVPVYDISVQDAHNFIANGIVVHNCDEMALPILDAALGQPMGLEEIALQVVVSSTHQYATGTMSEMLRRAKQAAWPVYQWCHRETIRPHGWLLPEEVALKRSLLSQRSWQVEVELDSPVNEGLVYSEFGSLNTTSDEPSALLPVELAVDEGYIDPRAILFVQRSGDRVLVFDELYHSRHLGEICVDEVLEKMGDRFGWLAHGAEDIPEIPALLPELAVGSPEAKDLQVRFRRANIPYRFKPHKIVEGIKIVRRLILDGEGYRALRVHVRCKNFLRELTEAYHYPEAASSAGDEQPVDEGNHACDAFRYWAFMRANRG